MNEEIIKFYKVLDGIKINHEKFDTVEGYERKEGHKQIQLTLMSICSWDMATHATKQDILLEAAEFTKNDLLLSFVIKYLI